VITLRIALVGDYSGTVPAHLSIPKALELASQAADRRVEHAWIPTTAVVPGALAGFDGVWVVPGSPYVSMDGALAAVTHARTKGIPFLGTCGGFQHAVIEYARQVLGMKDADHAESNPETAVPVMAPLECALVLQARDVVLEPDGLLALAYGVPEVMETYQCRYGVNPHYASMFTADGLRIAARDHNGEIRAVELVGHPFFVGTLFQPERSADGGRAHPLITAFVRACAAARRSGRH